MSFPEDSSVLTVVFELVMEGDYQNCVFEYDINKKTVGRVKSFKVIADRIEICFMGKDMMLDYRNYEDESMYDPDLDYNEWSNICDQQVTIVDIQKIFNSPKDYLEWEDLN